MATGWRGQYTKYRQLSLSLLAAYKQRSDIRAFLEIILSLVTVTIFIVFAIKPTALTMVSLNQEIDGKKKTLENLNKKISDLQTANNVYIQSQDSIPYIEVAVPTDPHPESITKQIMALAERESVTVTGISIDKTKIVGQAPAKPETDAKPLPAGASAMPFTVSVKGPYENLQNFLQNLEKLRIPIMFDSVSVTASSVGGVDVLVELITGRVPYISRPAETTIEQ